MALSRVCSRGRDHHVTTMLACASLSVCLFVYVPCRASAKLLSRPDIGLTHYYPSNAEDTFFRITRTQILLKTIIWLYWYSLGSCDCVLSDECPFVRVSVIFRSFASFYIAQISHHQCKGLKLAPAKSRLIILVKSYKQKTLCETI